MNTGEKLRAILKNLKNKKSDLEIAPTAFHLRELVSTIPPNPYDLDELEIWEYKIGEDILKIEWELEDMYADIIHIYLNDERMHLAWNDCKDSHYAEYDDDAEDLYLLIMQHGGILQPPEELEFVVHHLDDEILEKRKNRLKEYNKRKIFEI